ncbi:MAG: endonuclease V [Anaerolineae bacterium]
MKITPLHNWNVTPAEAIAIQREMVVRLTQQPLDLTQVRQVAGVDVSVRPDANGQPVSQAAVVVLTFPEMTVVEVVRRSMPTPFPYIPGLLTFREGPVLIEAFSALEHTPDAFLFDGMGIAHPRRMGIAAHLGLWLDRPTVGVGKTHLFGKYTDPLDERGSWTPLSSGNDVIGAVLRTRPAIKPLFISPGQRMDLPSALALVMACTGRYRLPVPIRAAHNAAGQS